MKSYRGLFAVLITMAVVSAGAFAITYYTWTVPARVEILTYTFTASPTPKISGATQAIDNWGTNATNTVGGAASPATDGSVWARIYLDNLGGTATHTRTFDIYFQVVGTDITGPTGFENLTIQINLYLKDDNLTLWSTGENETLSQVISGSTGNDVTATADNAGNGYQPGVTLDCVIHAFENTENVTAAVDVTIPIRVYVKEHGI